MSYSWRPYVPVARRRLQAHQEARRRTATGERLSPVHIEGRTIARTFWGKAWCDNLESYSDFENRLPRGRTYVRGRAILDLQIEAGRVSALVQGSSLYQVRVEISALPAERWTALCRDCASSIDSLVELLQGRLSKGVMERICRRDTGLFPGPREIRMACSCPDYAAMCKHIAATLYGVGARLDERPELLFKLRGVNEADLVTHASRGATLGAPAHPAGQVLEHDDLAALFDLDLAVTQAPAPVAQAPAPVAQASAPVAQVPAPVAQAPVAQAPVAPAPTARPKRQAPARAPKPTPKPSPRREPPSRISREQAELRAAMANVEAELASVRAQGGPTRTITVLEDWLAKTRLKLNEGT